LARVKVTRNYQVTIPEEVRDKIKIREGDLMEVQAVDSRRVMLSKIIPEEELAGAWDEEMDDLMKEVGRIWKNWKLPRKKTFA
jgi:AbrB family looped-hinge helix DNA binding protein